MSAKAIPLMVLCAIATPFLANAAVTNPGFETGDLSGWTLFGQGAVLTSSYGITPTHDTYQGFIDNTGNGSQLASDIVTVLGVPPSQIAAFMTGPPTRGSALYQDVTVSAGDVLTFDWNFLSDELNEDPIFDDFAFFSIGSSAFMLASRNTSTFTTPSPVAGYDGLTGWTTTSYTFTSAGTFRVGFGVLNVTDSGHDSAILLDAVNLPEPYSIVLPLMGAICGLIRRRSPMNLP